MFKPMKRLAPINYLLLLKDKKDDFWSDEINMTFDRWNKRYGNNIKVGGEDDTKKNNIQQIAQQVKEDLNKMVTQQTLETYEELAPQLVQLIDMTKNRADLTDAEKWDEIALHMMGYVKSCTNEIMVEVLAEILGLD